MLRVAFWILPIAVIPAAFFAASPWLKTVSQPMMVLITAAAVLFGMCYINYLSFRAMRRLDEVQKAGAAFAAQWGPVAGQVVFGLLLVLPPFTDFATSFVSRLPLQPGATVEGTLVVLSLSLGFVVLLALEAIGRVVVHTIWWKVMRGTRAST